MKTVLVVDDETDIAEAVKSIPEMNASQRLDMFRPITWRRLEP